MASKVQDITDKIWRAGYLQGKSDAMDAQLQGINNELTRLQKERDDIRQELEDTLWQVRRTNDTTDS